jgi:hypothetical protein
MALFRSLPEDDVEDLLAGGAPASPSAVALADVVAVLRADSARRGAPPMSAELRAQITAVRPTAAPSRRRRMVAGGVLGIVFGTSALGVAGAQNALPAVLQDAASSAADVVGIDLPRAAERHQDEGDGEGTSTDGSDPATQGEGSEGTGAKGPKETTPGGANPADPGTPGDKEPADPADPATGNGTDNGQGTGAENGQGNGTDNGQGTGTDNGQGTGAENGQGTGAENGQGEDASQGRRGGQP